jgi:hypothetical protein
MLLTTATSGAYSGMVRDNAWSENVFQLPRAEDVVACRATLSGHPEWMPDIPDHFVGPSQIKEVLKHLSNSSVDLNPNVHSLAIGELILVGKDGKATRVTLLWDLNCKLECEVNGIRMSKPAARFGQDALIIDHIIREAYGIRTGKSVFHIETR